MATPVSKFYIESDYRTDKEGIGELAVSIKATGLINPITVQQTEKGFEIIAGRRRFYALTEYLELTELEEGVHFMRREDVDPVVVQLEENLRRQDFKPTEVARLVAEFHEDQVSKNVKAVSGHVGGWTLADTGKLIGRTASFVSRMISVHKNRDDVENCKTLKEAIEVVKNKKKKVMAQIITQEKVKRASKEISLKPINDYMENFIQADATEFIQEVQSESVNLICTDPPYGISLDEVAGSSDYEVYSDKYKEIYALLEQLVPEFFRVLSPGGYCIIWTSFELYDDLIRMMKEAGFFVDTTPIVWTKLNASGLSMNPKQTLGSICEIAAYGWKESFAELSIHGRGNVFPYRTVRSNRIHVAQKPEELISDILNIFSSPGDIVLDVFAGSGSTLRACFLGNRFFFGCEIDEANYLKAKDYIVEWYKDMRDED